MSGYGQGRGGGQGGGWQGRGQNDDQRPQAARAPQTSVVTLQQFGLGEGVITSANFGAVASKLTQLRQNFNVVGSMSLTSVPAGFAIDFKMVDFNSEFTPEQNTAKSNGDFYVVQGGNLAFTKASLNKLQDLGAVSWIPDQCGRVDNGQDPHYCMYRAVGRVLNTDGRLKTITGEKEMDLREGSDQLFKIYNKKKERMSEEQIFGLRFHILAHAETKAKLRAIREHYGVRSYTRAEAKRPFLLVVLVPQLDMSDPEVRKMVTANALGIVDQVYGGPRQMPQPVQAVAYLGGQHVQYPQLPHYGAGQLSPPPYNDDDDDDRGGDPGPSAAQNGSAAGPNADPVQQSNTTAGAVQGEADPFGAGGGNDPLPPMCQEPSCGVTLADDVAGYSMRCFGEHYCRSHQQGKARLQSNGGR